MRNNRSELQKNTKNDIRDDQILVNDIARYLLGLARLHEEEKTGNIELSRGLHNLATALRPYADSPVSELSATFARTASVDNARVRSRKPKAELPPELESLSHEDVEKILANGDYTKEQVAELGNQRFGISRSRLVRLRKEDAREAVRAAVAHERSLDVISEEAGRGGRARAI